MTEPITYFHDKYLFLSNFWAQPLWHRLEKPQADWRETSWDLLMLFPTSEHAYQASKTLSLDWIERICEQPSPAKAKRVGRQAPIRDDWAEIKLDVMLSILRVKFKTPTLAEWLLETGDAELVEGNTWGDLFWGVCYGQGENHLGKLLVQVRKELLNELGY